MIRVLIVEDHANLRRALGRLLSRAGMEVVAAACDGWEGVRAVEDHRPDVVLMDIVMPGLDGISAATRIHRDWPGTRVVMISGGGDPGLRERALAAGALGLVPKDEDPAMLLRAVRDAAQV